MKSITYFDDEQKCWTSFSCDDCEDLKRLKAERDAAVRELEGMMFDLRCTSFCLKSNLCVTQNCYMRGTEERACRPKWRGPQQEET